MTKFTQTACMFGAGILAFCPGIVVGQDLSPKPSTVAKEPASESPSKARDAMSLGRLPLSYPSRALRENRQGIVRYDVTISSEGRVIDCVVTQSSGHAILDDAACKDVVRYGRYRPALDDQGNSVRQTISSKAVYSLQPATPE